ncbi:hypothetical protein [Vibrio phage CKB-S2]|nr:hypothetical protein [Vibrio phage CKB-S2]
MKYDISTQGLTGAKLSMADWSNKKFHFNMMHQNKVIGELYVNDEGVMTYKGNLDQGARAFFENVIMRHNAKFLHMQREIDRLSSSYGDHWYDGFIAAREMEKDGQYIEDLKDHEILTMSEHAEAQKAKGAK